MSAIKKSIDSDAGTVTFDCTDGTSLVFALSKLTPEMVHALALHGLSQKLGDSYAGQKEVRDAGGDVIAWALANVNQVWDNLTAGLWSSRREGSGSKPTQLARAIAEVYSVEPEEAMARIAELDEDELKALKKAPAIKKALAEIKAKDAQERADKAEGEADGEELPDLF